MKSRRDLSGYIPEFEYTDISINTPQPQFPFPFHYDLHILSITDSIDAKKYLDEKSLRVIYWGLRTHCSTRLKSHIKRRESYFSKTYFSLKALKKNYLPIKHFPQRYFCSKWLDVDHCKFDKKYHIKFKEI